METKALTEKILQYLDGRLSPEEEQALAAEIEGDAEAEQLLADMILMHGEISSSPSPDSDSSDFAYAMIKKETENWQGQAGTAPRRGVFGRILVISAFAAAIVLVGIFLKYLEEDSTPSSRPAPSEKALTDQTEAALKDLQSRLEAEHRAALAEMTKKFDRERQRSEDLVKIYQFKQDELSDVAAEIRQINSSNRELFEKLIANEGKLTAAKIELDRMKRRYNIPDEEQHTTPITKQTDEEQIEALFGQVKDAYYNKSDFDLTEELAEKVLAIDPNNKLAWEWKAEAKAKQHNQRMAKTGPDDAEMTLLEEHLEESLIGQTQIIQYPQGWLNMVKNRKAPGREKLAEEKMRDYLRDSEKVRKMHKAYAKNYREIAKSQYEKYRLEEAKENLKLALRYDPEDAESANLLEKVQGLLGERPSKVRTFYEWALREQKVNIDQRKTEMEGLVQEGKKLHKEGRFGEARDKFENALQIHRWMPYSVEFPDLKRDAQSWYDNASRMGQLAPGTEQYEGPSEKPFSSPLDTPLSTFSVDVDTASYSNVRRFINNGKLPPGQAVRIEELINYFEYDYPQPKDRHPFSITAEVAACPWDAGFQLLHIGLQGKTYKQEQLPESNLVFLLDVSGSMSDTNKLPLLKKAFKMLVEELKPTDNISIVTYAGTAQVILPKASGKEKAKILSAIDNLISSGSTAGEHGLRLAYKTARETFIKEGNNRIILATDGDFNVGESDDDELVKLIEQEREFGVFLTILGFGTGNYKDAKLEKIADRGNGQYAYVDSLLEAKRLLKVQLAGTLYTIAKDVKIQVEFNPAKVKAYRLLGYENRALAAEDFSDDSKDAGEIGAGHSVTALYEIIPADPKDKPTKGADLKYQEWGLSKDAQKGDDLMTVNFRYKFPDGKDSQLMTETVSSKSVKLGKSSNNFRFAAAVAEFGLLLTNSRFKGSAAYDQVIDLAKKAKGKDDNGHRAEFIKLVEMVELLQK
ncbi:von Willebrand factor type A domain-containing protein [Planctomycetota bacterium]